MLTPQEARQVLAGRAAEIVRLWGGESASFFRRPLDATNFVYRPFGGDGTIVARVARGTGGINNRPAPPPVPCWRKLTRCGDVFMASGDGQTWRLIGTVRAPIAETVFIGLAMLSHARGSLSRSSFESVEVLASFGPPQ